MSKKISAISLGCPKNLVDTEIMLGILKDNGYEFTYDCEAADILIINTCAFLESAKKESMDVISEYCGRYEKLIVAGCLVQLDGKQLLNEFPLIDHLIGVGQISKINEVVSGNMPLPEKTHSYPRIISTLPHTAYVKIADGCNNCCSYCLIPSLRGAYQSRDMEAIIKEVESLVEAGTQEINLIAQDTTYYGFDRYKEFMITTLLKELIERSSARWIRLMYTHPLHITQELIEIIADHPSICRYLDLPIQHIDDSILQAMNRRTSIEGVTSSKQIKELIANLKQTIDNIAIRTSIIVGFPGEGEDEFKRLLEFIEETEFEHLGVFPYSKEQKTPAFNYPNQVPDEVKEQRRHQVMELQQKISLKKKREKIGKTMNVVIEGYHQNLMIGRSQYEAPEIDGIIYVEGEKVNIGKFIPVKITAATQYDLIGTHINEWCKVV